MSGRASWRSFRRDWKDDDLTEVCEDLGHLTEVGAGKAAGENREAPSIPRVCYGREPCVSVTCVPKSAASCPSSQPHIPSHCLGLRLRKLQRKNARGQGLQPKVGWDGRGPYAQHFMYLRHPCRGSSSETPPGWALSAPGICEEGSRELAPCAESETGSQCVRSHNASSGLVLALRMGSFRERRLWPLKDL